MLPMLWGSFLRFSHDYNHNLIKCFKSPSVVGSDSMDFQSDKSNIDNEETFPMFWGSFLRFSHIWNIS
jgi:hypothetical protein